MNQSNTSNTSTFTTTSSNEQSSTTVHGQGYVHMGPLTTQHYDISSRCVNEIKDTNLTDTSTSNNQYQFKIMLLGDSGVGEFIFLF